MPRDARILDAGAGTGLVGEILASMGYRRMVAMDLSQGMLEEARKKGVYEDFHQMVMGETLDYETGSFDAVITVGVLTVGHAPASSLDELVRVTTAQRPHRLLAAAGRVREQRLSREAGCAGVAGEVAAGGANRGVPTDAQGRAGGIAQGLGVPRRRLTGGVADGQGMLAGRLPAVPGAKRAASCRSQAAGWRSRLRPRAATRRRRQSWPGQPGRRRQTRSLRRRARP